MFRLFKRRRKFDDTARDEFVEAMASMLEVKKVVAGDHPIEDEDGRLNHKAIGYIYGFIDAALRTIGQDMSNAAVGIPITYQVLRRLFPGCEDKYVQFLADHMGKNERVTMEAMKGGQQYIDFTKPGAKGAPMGLARYLIEAEKHE